MVIDFRPEHNIKRECKINNQNTNTSLDGWDVSWHIIGPLGCLVTDHWTVEMSCYLRRMNREQSEIHIWQCSEFTDMWSSRHECVYQRKIFTSNHQWSSLALSFLGLLTVLSSADPYYSHTRTLAYRIAWPCRQCPTMSPVVENVTNNILVYWWCIGIILVLYW